MSDAALLIYRPVYLRVNMKNRRFRRGVHDHEKGVSRIRWERLKDSAIKEEYERRTEETAIRDGAKEKKCWYVV